MSDHKKTFYYKDGCTITLESEHDISVKVDDNVRCFNDINKPLFDYGTGEKVIEYSGLVVDGRTDESWAKANYMPKGHAPLHVHHELTEDYYFIQGEAIVMIDGQAHPASVGDHIQVKPGQQHQVMNASDSTELVLIVKCTPSWTKNDYHHID